MSGLPARMPAPSRKSRATGRRPMSCERSFQSAAFRRFRARASINFQATDPAEFAEHFALCKVPSSSGPAFSVMQTLRELPQARQKGNARRTGRRSRQISGSATVYRIQSVTLIQSMNDDKWTVRSCPKVAPNILSRKNFFHQSAVQFFVDRRLCTSPAVSIPHDQEVRRAVRNRLSAIRNRAPHRPACSPQWPSGIAQ